MLTGTRTVMVSVVIVVVALALVVATLGEGTARPGRDGVLEIVMEGNDFTPSRMIIPAEEPVTLVFVNDNDAARNVAFGREVTETDGIPTGLQEDLFAGLSARVEPGRGWIGPSESVPVVTISVGGRSSTRVHVTFPRDRVGDWEMVCFRGRGCDPRVATVAEVTIR